MEIISRLSATAAQRLLISPARLYQLRHQWLLDRDGFQPGTSGGDHRDPWPPAAHDFLQAFLQAGWFIRMIRSLVRQQHQKALGRQRDGALSFA